VGGGAGATAFTNREVLTIPLTLQLQATRQVAVSLGTALSGPLSGGTDAAGRDLGFGDLYSIPVTLGVDCALTNMLDVGAAFNFGNVFGANNDAGGRDRFDDRFGKVFARIRL
jgi:hypothetical protein